ncbi:MAG: hypothetical protein JZU55_00925, partial [Afipia sp.]|nr:hypothetical protein [Afipia sp.]
MSDEKIIPFRTKPKNASKGHTRISFAARYLAALRPIYNYAMASEPGHSPDGALNIRPAPEGGIFIAAVSGHVTVVLHDREGRANGPATIAVPDDAFDVAEGPDDIAFTYGGGDFVTVPAPEWSQPGIVSFTEAGIIIQPRMPHPQFITPEGKQNWPALFERCAIPEDEDVFHGVDYRLTPGPGRKWPFVLKQMLANEAMTLDTLVANPELPDIIEQVVHALNDDPFADIFHRPVKTPAGPGFVTTVTGMPHFIAIWMGRTSKTERPEPGPAFQH